MMVDREVTMFQRFAAGTTVTSIVIAIAAVILSVISGLKFERIYPVTIFWCCVPTIWESGPC